MRFVYCLLAEVKGWGPTGHGAPRGRSSGGPPTLLTDPARLRLLGLIQPQPDSEACSCHLSKPTVSHDLKVLVPRGAARRGAAWGSWPFYRVLPEPLAVLRDLLG
jgi:hypothetical protein